MNKKERVMANVLATGFISMMVGVLLALTESTMVLRVANSTVQGRISLAILVGIMLTIIGVAGLFA